MAGDAEKRISMNVIGMAEVEARSHYLKGGDGAIPAQPGTGLFREVELLEKNLTIENLGVHAAKNYWGVCRGRWKEIDGGKQFKKGDPDRDFLLPKYLEDLKAYTLPSWVYPDFNNTGLFPRRSSDYLYLGEDCRNKRHFDCEGFVAWVLVKALNKDKGTWRKGVDWYQAGGGGRLEIYQASGDTYRSSNGSVITKNTILDGDILIRKQSPTSSEHIALACAKGSGVMEASGKDRGVQLSSYNADWTQLARIKDL